MSDCERIKELEEQYNELYTAHEACFADLGETRLALSDAQSDAERLRKAIGEAIAIAGVTDISTDTGCDCWRCKIFRALDPALSPSPAAASGEKQTESAVGAGGAGEISGSPKVAEVNGAGLIANLPNVEQTATTSVPTSAPAAESEGGGEDVV